MQTAASIRRIFGTFALLGFIGIADAAVVFSESGGDTLVKGVLHAAANVHTFTIDTPGAYQATIVDLASLDDIGFSDPFTKLKLAVTGLRSTGLLGSASLPPTSPSFSFSVPHPGTFAALVQAVAGCDGFGFYQIDVMQIAPIPEPAAWSLMLAGVSLIGWLRFRSAV